MYLAAGALGYMIGALVGTAIAQLVWGDEGAESALEFYGFGGSLPGGTQEGWENVWWALTTPSAW